MAASPPISVSPQVRSGTSQIVTRRIKGSDFHLALKTSRGLGASIVADSSSNGLDFFWAQDL